MKKSFALLTRALAAVLLWTSLFSAGVAPGRSVYAEPAAANVFAASSVTASAYGYVSDKYKPSQAIDGNLTSSKWVYQGGESLPDTRNPYWLKIDAGVEASVNQFMIAHAGSAGEPAGYNTRDFTIETSDDDVNWTPVVTVTGNTYAVTTHRLESPVTARYFKLNITNPGDADASTGRYTAQIYEFQAYGTIESPAAPAPLASLAAARTQDQGLLAEYYTGKSDFGFGDYKATTVDPEINFTNLEPALQTWTGQQDHVNIRWTGQIMPPQTDDYTFYMIGDNGFRLWVDDKPVIDHWVNDWDKEQTSGPVSLEGGKKYNLKIEYFEDSGGSNLYLRWAAPGMSKSIVPSDALFLPQGYTGPASAAVPKEGSSISLAMTADLGAIPAGLAPHWAVTADGQAIAVQSVEQGANSAVLRLNLADTVKPGQRVNVAYDGQGALQYASGTPVASFKFNPANASEVVNYAPIAIAMSFYGSPKTNRSFAWYTSYEKPQNAPANATDSIVEIVAADRDFNSASVKRFAGKPEDTRILNLKITNSTSGSFISHKVLAEGLTPGTAYKYRVGSAGNWSPEGSFMTEAENENDYEFLYMTDSQGSNSQDYEVFANTLKQGLEHYPNAKFMVMTGDQVDAGSLESQWLDYFGKPQNMFLKLPIMAAVGNHEGPYNDNYYYHFNYPNDSIQNPLPPGSVYSYDYGDAHIMVLNTMDIGWDDRQKESFRQQVEWLKKEVAQTDKKWKIVAFHKAIYSLGNHALDTDILDMRQMLYLVFDQLGIDVVLQGHDHTFMRSYQMYNDKPVADVQKDENGNALNPDGTLYMINNSAGTKYYDLKNGVDRYYAAVYEQPYEPIYSGIKMTDNSFTIESYKSGQAKPFDTYTIVRTDSKPNPVGQLTAGKTGDGKAVLSWNRPQPADEADEVRGFRIYETSGKLGMNWSDYVPAEKGRDAYQYIAAGTVPGETYEFAVKAVDKRDNSEASIISTSGNLPAAPTSPLVDDGYNTFGWTNVPGYGELADYEYSIDGGKQWLPVTANPQPVGDDDYPAGAVQVRVKANAATGAEAGLALVSNKPFTVNHILDTYKITGEIKRARQLQVNVALEPMAEYAADAYTVFELLDGDTPILVNAVPVKQNKLTFTQYFNVTGGNYKVKVFVIDRFTSDLNVPNQLARPITLQ
ncbi:PA14 domain-containing protein [Paenibacillus doosanensis]|uniref:PA14 domain-containing protein n=1 Tax=Paenibacillus doosanensis TaxID=1229154 RepID=UPI00217F7DE9|nr:PA14 domain-containing protein [Paenibacillus doosanensis]MCS7463156.1 PA14 domain-containing protein [Paenibacillus doosanensis]